MNKLIFPLIYLAFILLVVATNLFISSIDINLLFSVLLVIIFIVLRIFVAGGDKVSPDIVFVVFFYIFHFGYFYLYYLNLADYDSEIFLFPYYLGEAIFYLLICCSGFLLSYYIFYNYKDFNADFLKASAGLNNNTIYFLKILLILLFLSFWVPILSLAPEIFYDFSLMRSVGEKGLGGKFYWFGQIVGITIVSLYFYNKLSNGQKFFNSLFDILPLSIVFASFLLGQRTYFLFYAIVLVSIYHNFYRNINFFKLFLSSIIVFSFSAVIAVSRVESVYNPIDALNLYLSNKENGFIISALHEFGLTFKTIPFIMYLTEDGNYWYFKSYLNSLMLSLPNLSDNIRTSNENMDSWVTYQLFGDDTYGRGGSIAMEAYGSFGPIFGSFFFFILGGFTAKLYNNFRFNSSLYYFSLYYAFLGALMLWMRANSNFLFRILIWSLIITFLLLFFKKILSHKR